MTHDPPDAVHSLGGFHVQGWLVFGDRCRGWGRSRVACPRLRGHVQVDQGFANAQAPDDPGSELPSSLGDGFSGDARPPGPRYRPQARSGPADPRSSVICLEVVSRQARGQAGEQSDRCCGRQPPGPVGWLQLRRTGAKSLDSSDVPIVTGDGWRSTVVSFYHLLRRRFPRRVNATVPSPGIDGARCPVQAGLDTACSDPLGSVVLDTLESVSQRRRLLRGRRLETTTRGTATGQQGRCHENRCLPRTEMGVGCHPPIPPGKGRGPGASGLETRGSRTVRDALNHPWVQSQAAAPASSPPPESPASPPESWSADIDPAP